MSMQGLSVVVQAGGASRRMGQDKGLMLFRGQPLVQRVVQRLDGLGSEILVTTNHPEGYAFLGVPLVGDRIADYGALGGLYTALSAAAGPLVAVVACDMPFISLPLLLAAAGILLEDEFDAVVPHPEDGLQPFHAVYRREACLPLIEEAIAAQKRRVDAWFGAARLYFLRGVEISRSDPSGLAFLNVNTPEELLQAERLEDL